MELITEITNTIIGMCLIFQLLLFAQWLSLNEDYQKLSIATSKLLGTLNYEFDRTTRKLWTSYYRFTDNLSGYKTTSINYF